MEGKKLKYAILCIGIIVFGVIIVLAFKRKTQSNDLIQYLREAWDIELEDYAEVAEGEIEMHEDEEDTGVIKVKVRMKYAETVLELLKDNLGEITGNPYDQVPPFPSNSLVSEVETKEWKYTFSCSREGKYAKTRELFFMWCMTMERCIYISGNENLKVLENLPRIRTILMANKKTILRTVTIKGGKP